MTVPAERSPARLIHRFARPFAFPRGIIPGFVSAIVGTTLIHLWPGFELHVLAQGAARLSAFFCGSPVLLQAEGFAVPAAHVPVIVTTDCSAADFFCIVAALVSWQLAPFFPRNGVTIAIGLAAALPLTILVNAVRILTVAQAHRWLIPQFPDAYAPFLHLTTGVAVFLPSLITLKLLLEYYGHRYTAARH